MSFVECQFLERNSWVLLKRVIRSGDSTYLNTLLVVAALNQPVHVNTRQMDFIRVKLAGFDDLLYLSNAYFSSSGERRVEVASGVSGKTV